MKRDWPRHVLAIDPGTTESAFVVYEFDDRREIWQMGKWANEKILNELRCDGFDVRFLVLETIGSYGMPVGREVFETCIWIGRFIEAWDTGDADYELLYRNQIKLHLCNSARAKDANIRQALLDRFGGKVAVGTKAKPGPLYGIHGDMWSALAVAVCWAEQHKGTNEGTKE